MADQFSSPPSVPANSGEQPAAAGKGSLNTAAEAKADEVSPAPATAPVKALTKEEQMAAFEEDLKINDWGHQPC